MTNRNGAPAAEGELTGFTVAVTAARRAEEFTTLLARRGARVRSAAAIAMVPLHDDVTLRRVTEELIAQPPEVLIATTGIGFRGWIEAADGWGLAEDLLSALGGARVISRGPKPTGALRAAGLREEWSPASESSVEVLEWLTAGDDLAGRRVAVQLHGATDEWDPNPGFLSGLTGLGADVVGVPVYRWKSPDDLEALDGLIVDIATGGVDAVTFTSAPAVASILNRADELGLSASLRQALLDRAVVYCVGPVTAGPLEAIGVASVAPDRMRLGALARLVADDLPQRRPELEVAGHRLGVRAAAAVVDGVEREVSATGLALLKALAARPGQVRSREELLTLLPAGGDDAHAVEVAIGRLRSALGVRELIGTVVKRGYRLAV
ncbi:uroporphyrinogen-III synthase [Gordonia caeni]|uniref:Uroporphyrinogen-III synthase n=1 Tax=Gordonia caeni TaxID=1007097 RepID=A0ABP7P468_9ACTN